MAPAWVNCKNSVRFTKPTAPYKPILNDKLAITDGIFMKRMFYR